jgi:CRP-like cAMP-binding protein
MNHTALRNYLLSKLGHDHLQGLEKVLPKFEPRVVVAQEDILRYDQVCEYVYFVVDGALQVYAYDAGFNEKSRAIVCENEWCTSIESFSTGQPASEYIRALESTRLLQIKRADFTVLLQDVPHFALMYQRILEASYRESAQRLRDLMMMSAGERVSWLQTHKAHWLHRFSGKAMAAYLGMSPETYSRLKAAQIKG